MPATHMTEEQEEAQKHGFMHPANPNMADQTGAKCCNATPDPFDDPFVPYLRDLSVQSPLPHLPLRTSVGFHPIIEIVGC